MTRVSEGVPAVDSDARYQRVSVRTLSRLVVGPCCVQLSKAGRAWRYRDTNLSALLWAGA